MSRPYDQTKTTGPNLNKSFVGASSIQSTDADEYIPTEACQIVACAHVSVDAHDKFSSRFANELICHKNEKQGESAKQEKDLAEEQEFRNCFEMYPALRRHRLCTYPPGTCRICDHAHVEMIKQRRQSDPVVVGGDITEPSLPVVFHRSSLQSAVRFQTQPMYNPIRHNRGYWYSFRPCFEFARNGTCSYGVNCRFSHVPMQGP